MSVLQKKINIGIVVKPLLFLLAIAAVLCVSVFSCSIHTAARYGSYPAVWARLLLDRTAIDSPDKYGRTPLHLAAMNGHEKVAELLWAKGAGLNIYDQNGWYPIHYAAYHGKKSTYDFLKAKGAHIYTDDGFRRIHLDLIKRIVEIDDQFISSKDADGNTPLHLGIFLGDMPMVRFLLSKGAYLNIPNSSGATPLFYVIGNNEVMEELIKNYADLNKKAGESFNGMTLLHRTIYSSYQRKNIDQLNKSIQILLDNGADINAQDMDSNTPLNLSISVPEYEIWRLLLDRGADVRIADKEGVTPLHHAVEIRRKRRINKNIANYYNYGELIMSLIEKGADVNAKDNKGKTPLHLAVLYGDSTLAELLIENGADVNAQDNDGNTPYMQVGADKGVLNILTSHGASINSPSNGEYPIHMAVKRGDLQLALVLLDDGANINVLDGKGMSVLHILSQGDYPESSAWACAYFIIMGAKVNTRDQMGKTPLKYALEKGQTDIAAVLKKYGGME